MKVLLHGADYNYEQWLDRPDILDEDFRLMKETRCNVMAVGIFSWSMYEPREGQFDFSWMDTLLDRMHKNGLKAILATPSGSKPAWMSKKYPEICRVDVKGVREHHAGRQNHCRTSPIYRDKCHEINLRLAERYKNHPALFMWHVSNEYGSGRCYCRLCLDAFRAWLKKRYGTLDVLNQAWWTTFWSHRFSDWDEIYPADPSLNGMMLDWARFTSDQTIDFFRHESAPLKSITPIVPITTNFMLPDVGVDYYEFGKHIDVVSWDNYPTWHAAGDDVATATRTAFVHDLYRSVKKKNFLMMESTPSHTNWQGVSPRKRPNVHVLASLQAIAHGSDSVQYFQWRQSRGGEEKFHGAVMSHLGTTDTRVFQDVKQVGELLARLELAGSQTQEAEVAIVYDFQNAWAIDLAQLPRSVEKRYQETVIEHYAAFWRQNIPVDIISSNERDLGRYKLIVAPMLYVTGDAVAQAFKNYVEKGGHLVGTYLSGVVNDSDLCHLGGAPGPMSELFGLRVEETDAVPSSRPQSIRICSEKFPAAANGAALEPLAVVGSSARAVASVAGRGPGSLMSSGIPSDHGGQDQKSYEASHYADVLRLDSATAIAEYERDFLTGMPALTVNDFGMGKTWYMATRLGIEFMRFFYSGVAEGLGLNAAWEDRALEPGLSIRTRGRGKDQVTFVMNFNEHPIALDLRGLRYRDLVENMEVEGSVEIAAYGLALLTRVA